MATFSYNSTSDQDDLLDLVEVWADKVTATGQSIGINRSAVYNQAVQAMRMVLQALPLQAVQEVNTDGSGQAVTNGSSWTDVEVPTDLLRFLNLMLAEWDRPVHETRDPRSDLARLQYNPNAAGDARNPEIVKMADSGSGTGMVYRCWPQDSTPSIDQFEYVAETAPEDLPEEIQKPTIMQTAGYVLVSDKEQGFNVAFEVAQELMRRIDRNQTPMIQQAFEEVRDQEES